MKRGGIITVYNNASPSVIKKIRHLANLKAMLVL